MQAVLVASRTSLHTRMGVLEITHEMLERLEAHLRATGEILVKIEFYLLYTIRMAVFIYFISISIFKVTANMRGNSAEEVAERVLSQTSLSGLQVSTLKILLHNPVWLFK